MNYWKRTSSSGSFVLPARSLPFVLLLHVMLLSSNESTARRSMLCNPDDPMTCRFGGVCKPIVSQISGPDDKKTLITRHICRCPPVPCFKIRSFDPICGDDGRTHFNELCLRMRQCISQTSIKRFCKGFCTENCLAI